MRAFARAAACPPRGARVLRPRTRTRHATLCFAAAAVERHDATRYAFDYRLMPGLILISACARHTLSMRDGYAFLMFDA